MKRLIAAGVLFLSAQAAMALPFNPSRTKSAISLVVLESEINDVLRELTSKSIIGLTVAPNRVNWNEIIEAAALAAKAADLCPDGLDQGVCYHIRLLRIPISPDVFYPIYIKVKSAAFEFRADGKIFLDATIGLFIKDELASISLRLETSPQLVVGAPLQLSTSTQPGKPIGTSAFQTAKLSLCTDKLATQARLTDFTVNATDNTYIRAQLKKELLKELDKAIAQQAGNCYTLTEGMLPPRGTVAKGQRMEYPVIKVSEDLLELRTKLLVPKDVLPSIFMLLQ